MNWGGGEEGKDGLGDCIVMWGGEEGEDMKWEGGEEGEDGL